MNNFRPSLVDSKNVLPSLFHIKLCTVKLILKALQVGGAAFQEIQRRFPKLSEAKSIAGVCVEPETKRVLESGRVEAGMNNVEHAAWYAIRKVISEGSLAIIKVQTVDIW